MLRKAVCAVAVLAFAFSVAVADEFFGVIQKIDGNKITVAKLEGKGKNAKVGESMTLTAAADIKVVRGKFNKEEKKLEAGDDVKDGRYNKRLQNSGELGVRARITTDANTITQILI